MSQALLPTTREIREVVIEDIGRTQGAVMDCLDDGEHLMLRTVLPMVQEVLPSDQVQAGVAVLVEGPEVFVHPYIFRQVCRNGAIRSEAIQTRRIQRVEISAPSPAIENVMASLREAVNVCSRPSTFLDTVARMRSATEVRADMLLHLLPLMSHWPQDLASRTFEQVFRRFREGRDVSVFGLMNTVTSLARDERVPKTRWRLEELGGAVLAGVRPVPKPLSTAARARPACASACSR